MECLLAQLIYFIPSSRKYLIHLFNVSQLNGLSDSNILLNTELHLQDNLLVTKRQRNLATRLKVAQVASIHNDRSFRGNNISLLLKWLSVHKMLY